MTDDRPIEYKVPVLQTHFGHMLDIREPAGSVIVATLGSAGIKPVTLLLPHQLYTHRVERLLAEPGVDSLLVLANTGQWRQVAKRAGTSDFKPHPLNHGRDVYAPEVDAARQIVINKAIADYEVWESYNQNEAWAPGTDESSKARQALWQATHDLLVVMGLRDA